jgi:hypothetical protein
MTKRHAAQLVSGGLVAVGVAGCVPSNLGEMIKASSMDDNAIVCIRVTTMTGSLTFMRSHIPSVDLICDTLRIKPLRGE